MSSNREQHEQHEQRVAAALRLTDSGWVDEHGRPTTSRAYDTADGFRVGPAGGATAGVERNVARRKAIIARNAGSAQPTPTYGQPRTVNPPSGEQTDLIRRALAERQGHSAVEEIRAELNRHRTAGTLSRTVASDAITRLLAIRVPRTPTALPQQPLPDVPGGHYALASSGRNDLAFYRVDRPSEGAHAGKTFVKLVVGGKPDANVPWSHVAGILRRILEVGVEASRTLYGREIGQCWRCNRHLTDQASRDRGLGPECATKVAA